MACSLQTGARRCSFRLTTSITPRQIVDPHTGDLTTLGDWPPKGESDDPRIIVASDGVAVVEDFHTVSAYDASGAFVETYEAKYIDAPPTDDGHMPSLKAAQGLRL